VRASDQPLPIDEFDSHEEDFVFPLSLFRSVHEVEREQLPSEGMRILLIISIFY
jgi:hypothetical protein